MHDAPEGGKLAEANVVLLEPEGFKSGRRINDDPRPISLPLRPFHGELIDQLTQKLFNISADGAALHHQVGDALPSI